MKKIITTLLFAAACAFGAQAAEAGGEAATAPWREMLAKVKNLPAETGIAGFMKKEAPAYITGNYAEADRVDAKAMAGKDPHDPNSGYKTPNGYYDAKGKWIGGYFDDLGTFVRGTKSRRSSACPTASDSSS